MPGTKGHSGGAREGSGRPKAKIILRRGDQLTIATQGDQGEGPVEVYSVIMVTPDSLLLKKNDAEFLRIDRLDIK